MSEGKHLVGVDIGSSSIKVVELKATRKGVELVRAAFAPLPAQTIVDGHILNHNAVVETLHSLWNTHKFSRRDVAVGLYGQSVIVRKITVPVMTEQELEQQIDWEAKQHIPFDVKGMSIDYEVLRRRPDAGQMDLLLAAAKKDEVADFTALLREAKLKPAVVDTHAFALQNVFELQQGLPEQVAIALINVGASVTSINIVSDGISTFSREITNAGNSITEEIQKQAGIPFEQAEAYKCGAASGGLVPQEIQLMIDNACDALAGEIQRSLDFYLAASGDREVVRIHLCGGSAYLAPLCRAVERRARVPVEVFDPMSRLLHERQPGVDHVLLRSRGVQFVGAIGLALRTDRERRATTVPSRRVRVNLLDAQKRKAASSAVGGGLQLGGQGWMLALLGALLLEAGVLYLVYSGREAALAEVEQRNRELSANISAIQANIAQHAEIKAKLAELRAREEAIERLQSARTGPTLAMVELSRILSPGRGPTTDSERFEALRRENPTALPNPNWDVRRLWITQYSEAQRVVKIAGRARDGEDVSEFTRRLALSNLFADVKILPATKSIDNETKLELVSFQLSARALY